MKKGWASRVGLSVSVACALVGLLAVIPRNHSVSDTTPLPQGEVRTPDLSDAAHSHLRISLRLGLDRLARLLKAVATSAGENDGDDDSEEELQVSRLDLALSPAGAARINVDKGIVELDGKELLDTPLGSKTLTYAMVDISGSQLSPRFDSEWILRPGTDVRAYLVKIDVDDLNDWLAKQYANGFKKGYMRRQLRRHATVDIRPLAETLWAMANRNLLLERDAPQTLLTLRPKAAHIVQPVVDEPRRCLAFQIALDFTSVLGVGTAVAATDAVAPLPPLKDLPPNDEIATRFHLPIVVRASDLSNLWKAGSVPGIGGDFQIRAIDTTEKDGLLHGRIHFAFTSESGWSLIFSRSVEGIIRFQVRPTCDAEQGRLGIEDFSFTAESNSILVNLVGSNANDLIRVVIERAVTEVSDARFRRAEVAARTNVDDLLAAAIANWADSLPVLSDELRSAKAHVAGIEFKPTAITVKNGYVVVTLEAEATISVTLDNAEPKPAPATTGSDAPAT